MACGGGESDDSPATTSVIDSTTPTSNADTPMATWSRTDPPRIEGSTDEVVTGVPRLADGTYWGVLAASVNSTTTSFTVMRVHFGDACAAYAARTRGVQCMSGYTVQRTPSTEVTLPDDATVSVAALDDPEASYTITPSILVQLHAGEKVSSPAGYTWAPFPFVLTMKDGRVMAARQFWIP